METVCVNFIGAPGVGKTTIAARVFSDLKARG
jgi:adenylate kinase family enzyme